jgi:hypothetical protein
VDSISSELVDDYYKDDPDLKRKRRVTAIVGASYLLHLRATEPDRMGEGEQRLLDKLLAELDVPSDAAVELLKELEEHGTEDLLGLLEEDPSEEE